MYRIIVRSKRDRDAAAATLNSYYKDWDIELLTLKGARTLPKVLDRLKEHLVDDRFILVLLGREDFSLAEALEKFLPVNASVYVVPRARVRNARMKTIRRSIEIARAKLRLSVSWLPKEGVYILRGKRGEALERFEIDPAYDIFMGIGSSFKRHLEDLLKAPICSNPLLLRKFGGVHLVYCGKYPAAKLVIPDQGCKPIAEQLGSYEQRDVSLSRMLAENREILALFENISLKFLKRFTGKIDSVIVPWSGGKDSTASLILALKAFGRKKVMAVYVDTGVDFPQNREYVEKLAKDLSVKLIEIEAGVRDGLKFEKLPLPTHENRWCTARKIFALEKIIDEMDGEKLVIAGDRDPESELRAQRPPIRRIKDYTIVTPIKQWSTAHVQLYLLLQGVPLNPLYYLGFYRLGCYICPALRSWEIYLMLKSSLNIPEKEIYMLFLKSRVLSTECC